MSTPPNKPSPIRTALMVILVIIVVPFLPLLISGRWGWWEAWVYALLAILGFAVSRALAARRHPDLLAERARGTDHADAAPWDKTLAPLVGLGGSLIPLVAGLEARFGHVVVFPLTVKLIALALLFAGYALGSAALIANRYFSGMVRIQTDRDHQVVTGGPYAWMRHPGYTGALLTFLTTPIFLDSVWALLPALLLSVALVIRTRLEDRYLQAHLPGYRDYTTRTRYRLLPGVW